MATNTTNFGLKKPAYTDTADIADINGNMDKVDVSLNGLADAIAIVANNNTHAAITAGQYVYVHGHSTLAEGLYTAKSNIAANATLSTSNLQADGSGGLNALNSKLNNYISFTQDDITDLNQNISSISLYGRYFPGTHLCFIDFNMTITANIAHNTVLFVLPTSVNAPIMPVSTVISAVNATSINAQAAATGNGSSRAIIAFGSIPSGNYIRGCLVMPTT